MLLNYMSLYTLVLTLINQSDIVTVLIVVVIIFSILLIFGVRKSYKLKKENDRLNSIDTKIPDEADDDYTDFTEGHMYDNK
ncbi:hypothetical protein [Flavivirga jejuensis]|uniref:Cbb3-type cytochrome oxidase component FixQ n=1 Tax=Flavivirga jejuensis TaxID=870487 RepID=A0ABT8WRV9_9FLAO|nr:hypothetical protein [Flavivirga jejuensis]MDO5975876.1 hypothetical protein [Flavivirga jejuensis]